MDDRSYRADVLSNGDIVLVEDALGVHIEVRPDEERVVDSIEMTEGEWHKVFKADRSKHDVVLDKANKSLTLKLKSKQDKKS